MTMDEAEILRLYNEGKRDYAFNLIMRSYSEPLYRHIRKMVGDHDDTDDLLQNTFIKAWRYLPDFREESRLYTWLYRIATNEAITFLKRERVRSIFRTGQTDLLTISKLEADPYFSGTEVEMNLQRSVRKLPPKQRAVFILKYFEDLKYEEIAQILGGTVGSLKASYHHACLKIEKSMKVHD